MKDPQKHERDMIQSTHGTRDGAHVVYISCQIFDMRLRMNHDQLVLASPR